MPYPPKEVVLFPDDVLLRERGFIISHRPPGREAVWIRDGTHYQQTTAIRKARAERKEQLDKLEAAYSS